MYWFTPPKQKPAPARRKPYARVPDTCKVSGGWYLGRDPQGRSEPVPSLRLRGRWLQQAGFEVGAKLRIIRGDGEITLQVIKE